MTAPILLVPAPTFTPARFGLLSVATLVDDQDLHWLNGIEYDLPARPSGVVTGVEVCQEPDDLVPAEPFSMGEDAPYQVAVSVACKQPGRTEEEFDAQARAQLAAGESQALEGALWTVLTTDATTLASGDDLPPAAALGALEAWLWTEYGGVGVIHVDRSLLPLLAADDLVKVESGQLRTVLGTLVSAGAYGDDGTLVATPAVTYRRSPIRTVSTFDHKTNARLVRADRYLLPSWENLTATVGLTTGD